VTTASTRSPRRKGGRARGRGEVTRPRTTAPAEAAPAPAAETAPIGTSQATAGRRREDWPEIPDRLYAAVGVLILIVAAGLRMFDLPLVPFHHDEGVNGNFMVGLVRTGTFTYDPANYHGPTLFYFALASEFLFGMTDFALRFVPALFGLGTVALMLALRPFVGPLASLGAAGLVALSPGAVYFSRYFIHESLLVFFSLAIVVALLWYVRKRRERYLLLAAGAAALLFATKETGIITVAVMAIAAVVGMVYVRWRDERRPAYQRPVQPARRGSRARGAAGRGERWSADVRALFPPERLLTAGFVFVLLYVLFFTSFFSNPGGLTDSLATFTIWTQTGGATQTQPLPQYLTWMSEADPVILILGFVGGLLVAWRGSDRIAVFIGLWALGITLAYSVISYKVPWIALNMLIPLAILGGIAISEAAAYLRSARSRRLWAFGAAALVGCIGLSTYQAVDLNFNRYDDEHAYPYVFVHTTREALALVAETERVAAAAGDAPELGITFVTPEYWPLPWYYRDNPLAGFFGRVTTTEQAMIVARADQETDLRAAINDGYEAKGTYTLRPGVELVLWVRNDLAGL
jgi:uncharacterized protein (TIGR03663 family)